MEKQKIQKIENLTHRQKIEQFSSSLQMGDLGISQFIDYGFVQYGQTKVGKTATGHYLCGNPLKGQKIKGQDMVEPSTSKNRKSKIGNTNNSETTIPNFFQIQSKSFSHLQGKVYLIDTPGYGDSNGVLPILSNGYFHYRLYSKVKNMKFILCFDVVQMKNTAKDFLNTVAQFTASFKDYSQKKQEIWKSCAFLFTKVDDNESSQSDLIEKLQSLGQSKDLIKEKEKENEFKDFLRFIIKEKRIFHIKKIRNGESAVDGTLLQKIDKKVSHWWSRQIDEKRKEVDMNPIQFSLAKKIIIQTTNNQTSQQQFSQLIKYYNIRIKEFLKSKCEDQVEGGGKTSLSFVLNQLVDDSMGHPESRNFLEAMNEYIKKYYHQYNNDYKEEREKREKQLFSQDASASLSEKNGSSKSKLNDKNFVVKKFDALKHIQVLKSEINYLEFQTRSLGWLQECEKSLYNIIKEFNKVSYKRANATQIIYKYGYLIHRIVQEAKVFLILIDLSSSPENKKKIIEAADNDFFDLMRLLKDFMGRPYMYNNEDHSYDKLHQQFIKKFNIADQNYSKLVINESFINFFISIDFENDSENNQVIQKTIPLILKYSDQILDQSPQTLSINHSSTNNLLSKLTLARINCQDSYQLETDAQLKDQKIVLIRKITKNLGKVLEHLGKYELARKVFDTIKYVDSVCRLYKLELQGLEDIKQKVEENKTRSFNLRMKYCAYMAGHFREHTAIQLLQNTFELAEELNELTTVKNELNELRLQMRDREFTTKYEKNLFNDEYFQNFTDNLQKQLDPLAKNKGVE